MNSNKEYQNWHSFFYNLGSRVDTKNNKKIWMDLEHFIVLGTKYTKVDARIFTAFIHACIKLAPILSPFKIKKIATMKLTHEAEFKILGFIVTNIQNSVRNKTQWNSLIKFCKENSNPKKEFKLFNSSAFKADVALKRWGLIASKLELDNCDKYLNTKKLFKLSVIRMRFNGVKTVYSDLVFYREFFGEDYSLNQISKEIYHDYNSVYQANEHLLIAA